MKIIFNDQQQLPSFAQEVINEVPAQNESDNTESVTQRQEDTDTKSQEETVPQNQEESVAQNQEETNKETQQDITQQKVEEVAEDKQEESSQDKQEETVQNKQEDTKQEQEQTDTKQEQHTTEQQQDTSDENKNESSDNNDGDLPPLPEIDETNENIEFVADQDEDRVEIMREWEELMQNFIPDEMLTFEVQPKEEEIFIEDIKLPTKIRGAFFSSYSSNEKVDFIIRDPTKKKIFHKFNKREGIFSVNVTDIGEYQFIFSNLRGKDLKSITFAVDVHNTTELHLQQADFDPVEQTLELLSSGIRDYSNEQRFSSKRQTSLLESIQKAHKRLMLFSIIEVLLVVLATSWQVYYIKKILDNKRIV